jgi:hypothetical protein
MVKSSIQKTDLLVLNVWRNRRINITVQPDEICQMLHEEEKAVVKYTMLIHVNVANVAFQ